MRKCQIAASSRYLRQTGLLEVLLLIPSPFSSSSLGVAINLELYVANLPPSSVARLFSYLVITVIIICVECCPAIWYALGREGGEEGEWQAEREMEKGTATWLWSRHAAVHVCLLVLQSTDCPPPLSTYLPLCVDNPALAELP